MVHALSKLFTNLLVSFSKTIEKTILILENVNHY